MEIGPIKPFERVFIVDRVQHPLEPAAQLSASALVVRIAFGGESIDRGHHECGQLIETSGLTYIR